MKNIFYLFFLLCSLHCFAQENKNLQWSFSHTEKKNGNIDVVFSVKIDDGWHLYSPYNPQGASRPLVVNLVESPNYKIVGKINESFKPIEHYDEFFDATEKYFEKNAKFTIEIKPLTNNPFDVSGNISGQICNQSMVCSGFDFEFKTKITPKKQSKPIEKPENKDSLNFINQVDNQVDSIDSVSAVDNKTADTLSLQNNQLLDFDKNSTLIADNTMSLWQIFILAALAGLAAIFTPCVFPMIPMTVSYFLKKDKLTARKGAFIYGLSIVAIYTLPIALLITISNLVGGQQSLANVFNSLSTHWLPNILFFIIFFVFALSFLGMFEITLPSWIANSADKKSSIGGIGGIFFMALVLVVVSFSCTGPIVGTVLVQSAIGGNAIVPIVAMFGFSIAFALPFTLFAFFPHWLKKLPKSGGWLNTVKVVLGFVELALGLKFLSVADQTYHWHILDRETYLSVWIAIAICLFMYLLGIIKLPNDSNLPFIKVPRLILSIIILSFVIYLIPGLWGAPLKALSGYIPPLTTQDFNLNKVAIDTDYKQDNLLCDTPLYSDFLSLPHGINGYFDYGQALDCARMQNKPLLIVFTGHGCVNCRKMEENVWSNKNVLQTMKSKFVIVALYTDDKTQLSNNQTIGKQNSIFQIERFGLNAQPYYVVVDPYSDAKPLYEPMAYNPDIDSFLNFLNKVDNFKIGL